MARYFKNIYLNPKTYECQLPPGSIVSPANFESEALDTINLCLSDPSARPSVHDGCLYTGIVGVIWASLRISQIIKTSSNDQRRLLHRIQPLLEETIKKAVKDENTNRKQQLAFLGGLPGVWLTAATFYHIIEEPTERNKFVGLYAQLAPHFLERTIFPQGSDEIFIGRGGYLVGLHELRKITGETVLSNEEIFTICDAVIASGKRYARKHHSQSPLMFTYHDKEYLGVAHGLCGILFALMLFPDYLKQNTEADRLVKGSLAYLMSVTPEDTGNLPSSTSRLPPHNHRSADGDDLVHWCHGATGVVFAYARAFLLWKNEEYLKAARRCADVIWHRGFLRKGPGFGQCCKVVQQITPQPSLFCLPINFGQYDS